MAHECPSCYMTCHCNGDIDDICFNELPSNGCNCCDDDEWDECAICGECDCNCMFDSQGNYIGEFE